MGCGAAWDKNVDAILAAMLDQVLKIHLGASVGVKLF